MRTVAVPLVIDVRVWGEGDDEAIVCAIRGGANNFLLFRQAGSEPEQFEAAMKAGQASAVPVLVAREAAASTRDRRCHWLQSAGETLRTKIECGIAASGASGRAAQVLAACRSGCEVEHLIVFNAGQDRDARFVEQMMAHGRVTHGAIPGVRSVFTARVLRDDAR